MEVESEEELLEEIDAGGRVLSLRPRRDFHGNPELRHRAVHVMVRNRKGDVFLQKRSRKKRIQPGKWDTSVGGHVDPGESYEAAALREVEEELGVTGVELAHLHDYVWQTEVETEHVRTFELTHEGPFRLHPEEIDEGRFFAVEELRSGAQSGTFTPNLVHELGLLGVVRAKP
jgi:isopentenyldiphosphate isomerase